MIYCILDLHASIGKCPDSHPFAFFAGDQCCKYNVDESGKRLTLHSLSCKGNEILYCKDAAAKDFCNNAGMQNCFP